jgi:hypothetical protein
MLSQRRLRINLDHNAMRAKIAWINVLVARSEGHRHRRCA